MEAHFEIQQYSSSILKHSLSFPLFPKFSVKKFSPCEKKELYLSNDFIREDSSKQETELPVYGTFIHEDIIPGFRYKVRENGTNKMFFKNKAKYLESIGQGYGKRLTFQSDDILENENFFWSDSNPLFGYSFFIEVVSAGDEFTAKSNGGNIGIAVIKEVDEKQVIVSTENRSNEIQKDVKVILKYYIKENTNQHEEDKMEVYEANALVSVVKKKTEKRCKITQMKVIEKTGRLVEFVLSQ